MINLDDIQSRVDRGQYSPKDVAALLGEGASLLDSLSLDRFNKGVYTAGDVRNLYNCVETNYKALYGRPTTADRTAQDRQASAAAQQAAVAARFAAAQAAAQAEAAAQTARLAQAQQVTDANAQAVAAKAAVDQFVFSQKAASAIVAERDHKALSLVDQLGDFLPTPSNATPAQELGTQDPQTN